MKLGRLVKKLKALSDANRLKILYLLSLRPACVCELTALLSLSQPTLTRHLQKLEDCGFIKARRYKFYQIYSLACEDEETKALAELALSLVRDMPELNSLIETFGEKSPYIPLEEDYGSAARN